MSPSGAGRERSGCNSADPQLGQRLMTATEADHRPTRGRNQRRTVIRIVISSCSVHTMKYLPGLRSVRR